jgi:hypothetical protein
MSHGRASIHQHMHLAGNKRLDMQPDAFELRPCQNYVAYLVLFHMHREQRPSSVMLKAAT